MYEEMNINKSLWNLLSDAKASILAEEIRCRKIVFDARAWYDCHININSGKLCEQHEEHFDLKVVFWQLYNLIIDHIRPAVVFESLSSKHADRMDFEEKCKGLLSAMSIPYMEVDNIDGFCAQLIEKNIVECCITESSLAFLYNASSLFRYSESMLDCGKCRKTPRLVKYSCGNNIKRDHLMCFYGMASTLLNKKNNINNNNDNNNKEHDDNGNIIDKATITVDHFPSPIYTRPLMPRACKKPYMPQPVVKHQKIKSFLNKLDDTGTGSKTMIKVQEEFGGAEDNLVLLSGVVKGWSENPVAKLERFQKAFGLQNTGITKEEKDVLKLFQKHELSFSITELIKRFEILGDLNVQDMKWKRPHLKTLKLYLQHNLFLSLPTRQLLGYIVSYDLFQLLDDFISGDSYPDGISRPEKVTKLFKKNGQEMYRVKWYYIPGAEEMKQRDLVTTEFKTVFSAAFPKIASKYEGWNLSSSDNEYDDDEDDDMENNDMRDDRNDVSFSTPSTSSTKKPKKRRTSLMDSGGTPASSGSGSKTTMKHFFVIRKKLTFDTVK